MTTNLLTILTFAAGVLVVLGVYSFVSDLVLRDRAPLARRLDAEARARQREQIRQSPLFRDLDRPHQVGEADEAREPLRRRLTVAIEQSGVNVTLDRLVWVTAAVGLGVGLVAGLLRQNVAVGLVAALLAGSIPALYVARQRKARRDKLTRQLPDAFDLMARVVRAGQTTTQAIDAVAGEFDQPIAGEFAYCAEQQNLGLAPDIALRDLGRRTGLLEIKIFVVALLVQQQTGGNLAEILDKLAAVVRERFRVQAKVRALTAEGRLQAAVLLVLPFAIMAILMLLSRQYAEVVVEYPGLVLGMIGIELVGALWIRKVVRFDF